MSFSEMTQLELKVMPDGPRMAISLGFTVRFHILCITQYHEVLMILRQLIWKQTFINIVFQLYNYAIAYLDE